MLTVPVCNGDIYMKNEKLFYLIKYLLSERSDMKNVKIPDDEAEQFRLYRSLVNIRP